jgi:hypothetical protein
LMGFITVLLTHCGDRQETTPTDGDVMTGAKVKKG